MQDPGGYDIIPLFKNGKAIIMKLISKKTIYYLVFLFSILLQGISILQYLWKNEEALIIDWVPQYIAVVAVSIACTAFQYLIRNRKGRYGLFFFRFLLILIIHFPASFYIGLKQMFLIAFLLDLSFLLPFPLSGLISFLTFTAVYSINTASQYWARQIPLPVLHDILYVSVYSLLTVVFFTLFRYFYEIYSEQEDLIRRLNRTINKLTDANSGFQHYIRIVEEKSTEDERNRIIREIHDSIGYTLTTVMMLSTSLLESEKENLSSDLKEVLQNISSYSKNGLNDMRIVLRILKIKNENRESDYIQLRRMITAFEKATNISVRLEYGNAPNNFSEEASHLVFRLVQEGMVNALRHGLATHVDVFLFLENGSLVISISDNGKGFRELTPGIGLKGMKERLSTIDGDFSISSSPQGVKLRIVIPMDKVMKYETDKSTAG